MGKEECDLITIDYVNHKRVVMNEKLCYRDDIYES